MTDEKILAVIRDVGIITSLILYAVLLACGVKLVFWTLERLAKRFHRYHFIGMDESAGDDQTVIVPVVRKHIFAPWTEEQVQGLREWQKCGNGAAVKCCVNVPMEVTPNGFVCPQCKTVQTWAHASMIISKPILN